MRRVAASVTVPGRAEEAEALWLDRDRWASWVDGFAHVERIDPGWPEPGARLRWVSVPRGRGLVEERVLAHEPARRLELAVEDEQLHGTQRTRFEPGEDEVRITLELEYELKERPFPLVDRLFVRRALQDALRRTVARFGHERRAELDPVR
jgi:polyketide cyclase/dehydrase/lipid transport protein